MCVCVWFLQIGSYYGSVIAPLDIDGDGVTDNLLVAAPMFFSGGMEKGKVYIYRVTELVCIRHPTDTLTRRCAFTQAFEQTHL